MTGNLASEHTEALAAAPAFDEPGGKGIEVSEKRKQNKMSGVHEECSILPCCASSTKDSSVSVRNCSCAAMLAFCGTCFTFLRKRRFF